MDSAIAASCAARHLEERRCALDDDASDVPCTETEARLAALFDCEREAGEVCDLAVESRRVVFATASIDHVLSELFAPVLADQDDTQVREPAASRAAVVEAWLMVEGLRPRL